VVRITGLTANGNAVVTGGLVPAAAGGHIPDAVSGKSCAGDGNSQHHELEHLWRCRLQAPATVQAPPATSCSSPAGSPLYAADLKLTGGAVLHLKAGTYNFNSISLQATRRS
jgi:hypothetical protein